MHCLSISALFQCQLKFTSGLGNEESLNLMNKDVSTFKGHPLLHLKHFFHGECIVGYDETHKIQVYMVM